ncbi:hypothetical protein HK097_006754 [Rhizophlyctis rosea]|uniref:Uncharacterized protein n=1 Tax=Rhizophlyctis rosea TaxID=64517 RepID=A0AAD5SEL7_9FUNG|nr:hypothetical protein HK097_006754 [Rhizophlyctis rosea]
MNVARPSAPTPTSGKRAAPAQRNPIVRELLNPGNVKILFHGGIFAAAVWLFSKQGDLLAI